MGPSAGWQKNDVKGEKFPGGFEPSATAIIHIQEEPRMNVLARNLLTVIALGAKEFTIECEIKFVFLLCMLFSLLGKQQPTVLNSKFSNFLSQSSTLTAEYGAINCSHKQTLLLFREVSGMLMLIL